jgi:hypothetical protein
MLDSGGVGRVATSTTGLSLASLRLAPALPLKSKEYYQLIYSKKRMRIITRYGILRGAEPLIFWSLAIGFWDLPRYPQRGSRESLDTFKNNIINPSSAVRPSSEKTFRGKRFLTGCVS